MSGVLHLVWAGVVVRPASYDKELAGTARHGRRADSLFHWSHLCPAVGERVVTLDAAEAALPIIAAYSIDLRADTQNTSWVREIMSNVNVRHTSFHLYYVKRNTYVFKVTSLWVWTIVSTSALQEPVYQVQRKRDVLLLNKHHYPCPCCCRRKCICLPWTSLPANCQYRRKNPWGQNLSRIFFFFCLQ